MAGPWDNVALPRAPEQARYAAPLLDFSPIGNLATDYYKGAEQKRQYGLARAFEGGLPMGPGGQPDYGAIVQTLAKFGDTSQIAPLADIALKRQFLAAATQPDEIFGGGLPPPPAAPPAAGAAAAPPVATAAPQPRPTNGYTGGDAGSNTIMSIAADFYGDEKAGQVAVNAGKMFRLDPNEPLTPDQAQKVTAAFSSSSGRQPGQAAATAAVPAPQQPGGAALAAPGVPTAAPDVDPAIMALLPPGYSDPQAAMGALRRAAARLASNPYGKDRAKEYSDWAGKISDAVARFSEARNPPEVRMWQVAREQGDKRSFSEWRADMKKAGATQVAIDQKGEGKFAETAGKTQAEMWSKTLEDGVQAGETLGLVQELRRLGGKIDTGAGAVFKQYLGAVGIKTEGISDIEAMDALINKLTPQQRVPGTGATSDFDAKMFKASLPSLMNTPQGNTVIIDTIEALARARETRADIAARVLNKDITPQQGIKELRGLPNPFQLFNQFRGAGAAPKTPPLPPGFILVE